MFVCEAGERGVCLCVRQVRGVCEAGERGVCLCVRQVRGVCVCV